MESTSFYILYFSIYNTYSVVSTASKLLRNVSSDESSTQMLLKKTWFDSVVQYKSIY
jgi:hypothetical protein